MAENNETDFLKLAEDARERILNEESYDPIALVEKVYQLWWHWADFQLYIISPTLGEINPPLVIGPEVLTSGNLEFVYPIHDYGTKLTTSKGEEMYSAGMSMCKLYFTIEKMIYILIERMKETGSVDKETEVQIAFGGHELAQRKAFESVINLSYNVVVTNFDPGVWGERYLRNVKNMAEKGYGYPPEAPRYSLQISGFSPNKL